MSMFEIFAIVQDWYSGNHELASTCLAAHTHMTIHEAHAYLDEYGDLGMTMLFKLIVEDWVEEAPLILDNMLELRDWLDEIIRDLRNEIDEVIPNQPV